MPATYTDAPTVKEIADELIPLYHPHLLEHRVRIEYLFSDQKIETNGRARWGDARRITSLAAFLAGEAEEEQAFEPLTFVCTLCRRWREEPDRDSVTSGDTTYPVCKMCAKDAATWDLHSNKVIAKFQEKYENAVAKFLAGTPEVNGFFVVCIYETYWHRMKHETKRAVVDHELCHLGATWDKWGDTKLFLNPHDVEEFSDVIRRHGYEWRNSIKGLIESAKSYDAQGVLELSREAA